MKVICISGKARHGKDTVSIYLKEALEEKGNKVLICHYGDLVKYVCRTFFDWDGQKDEKGRTLLQLVGTDRIRNRRPDYWVEFIEEMLMFFYGQWDYVLIPDCRFPNEIQYLKDKGHDVLHIRVERNDPNWTSPLTEEQQKHPSETALDNYKYDRLIYNNWDLETLRKHVYGMANMITADVCIN